MRSDGVSFGTDSGISPWAAGRRNNWRPAPTGWRHRDLPIDAERRTDNALAAFKLLAQGLS
jgi:hypothetical protein